MKLIGELKKQVESTATKEEAKDVIANAGMELTDDELDNIVGGWLINGYSLIGYCQCDNRYVGETGYDCEGKAYKKCGNCGGYISWG